MLIFATIFAFVAVTLLVIGAVPAAMDDKPRLRIQDFGMAAQTSLQKEKNRGNPLNLLKILAVVAKPLLVPDLRKRISKDIAVAQLNISPEEFMLIKIVLFVTMPLLAMKVLPSDLTMFGGLIGFALGYYLPEFWLQGKIKGVKEQLVRQLPDAVDLLGLCVNAGLDFMMALKWVVDKSAPSVVITEMNNILQEINVGKPRRDALRDLSKKYDLPDLSTFARTLIQADKMGTSVSEALNILSEDMRLARYRRGEAIAMKAPLKLLVPLLFCIFPVVGILVAGPIFLDFMVNNPLQNLGGG
ncbi:MAG: type II secretion system F family protein [Candidatus Omnitrophica bacterium]|nr:type II secretion system F family protein [Candidatus Omnitrophota bacterium]